MTGSAGRRRRPRDCCACGAGRGVRGPLNADVRPRQMRPLFLSIVFSALLSLGCADPVSSFGVVKAEIARCLVRADIQSLFIRTWSGTYAGTTKSGAGYFYDEVLEYRVWQHPERGAPDLASGDDYFAAFAQYERAAEYAKSSPGAEEPLVLVRQIESINEPTPGEFQAVREERVTEWQVGWLDGSKRGPNSIEEFLRNPPSTSE